MTPAEIYRTARPDRFARTIRTDSPEGCRIAILGLPDDTGVALNGGRVGAKDGPRAFREALAGYGTRTFVHSSSKLIDLAAVEVFDAGDVEPIAGGTVAAMEATHDRVHAKVRELLSLDLLPVCIGGGHDLTWPAVRALADKHPDLVGVYFDAHLDVREEPGSGMAFRRILNEKTCQRLMVVGLDPHANTREHFQWFLSHGGECRDIWDFMKHQPRRQPTFCSFDLDCINASEAPGVSAINPAGITEVGANLGPLIGGMRHLSYFDIMELNPKYDIDGRTARLAARLFLSFVAGYAMRDSR